MTSPPSSSEQSVISRTSDVLVVVAQNLEKYLMYCFYIYLLFIIIAEVIRRYALGFASLWGEETARFSYIFITYLGISWAAHKRTHIRIDMIYGLVSDRTENYLYLFSDLMMILFAAYAFWYSLPLIQTSLEFGAKTQALRVSRAIFQIAVPLGFSLMSVRVLQRAYEDIHDIRAGRPVYKGENIFFDEDEDGGSSDAAADGGKQEVSD
jgi:TRAP-type C4-dicarboxylate transport system permease small subunit